MVEFFVSGLFPGTGRFPDIALEITGKCKFIRKFHNAGNFFEGMSLADQCQATVYHKTVDQLLGRDSRTTFLYFCRKISPLPAFFISFVYA